MTEQYTVVLPEVFRERMKTLLQEDYEAFIESYEKPRVQALRLNPLKGELTKERQDCREFSLTPVPWVREGFYYPAESRPGKHPYHEAGVYYIQEPSAMAAVELLAPEPGERILDLCAAPGGKSTQIAAKMNGQGLLVTNEIHPARAKILSQNIERMGITNAVVCNETSGRLAGYFPEFFDRILVDAPCSGEGMFRKEQAAAEEWSRDAVLHCAARQREILKDAADMLKPGGTILYSTCTFSPEENEQTIAAFLAEYPAFSLADRPLLPGLSEGRMDWAGEFQASAGVYRIWPHKTDGEGHFFAVLKKTEAGGRERKFKAPAYLKDKTVRADYEAFRAAALPGWNSGGPLIAFGDQLYQIPELMPAFDGLKVLRPGLHLGTAKKNRFEPSHALALALTNAQAGEHLELARDDDRLRRYLAGEGIEDGIARKGWVLICVDGYTLGWGKASGTQVKNHYPKGLRLNL